MKTRQNIGNVRWISGVVILLLIGCGGRPNEEMSAAEKAILNAALAQKCAPEEYRAAQRMYAKAEAYAKAKEYSKAELAAKAAEKLAKKAEQKAIARKDECLKAAKPPVAVNEVKTETIETPSNGHAGGMQTVYFGFNAFKLDDAARTAADANVKWLGTHPSKRVQISGHCDNRGSAEFNLILGEKRAQSVRQYLIAMGIAKDRIDVLSYGEEKLADFEESDGAHSRNRRTEFLQQ